MSFLSDIFKNKHGKVQKSSENQKIYANVWEEAICRLLAVHDHNLPVAYKVISRLPYAAKLIEDVVLHLKEREIIIFDLQIKSGDGRLMDGFFHLKNPHHGDIMRKRMTNEQYYDALFWTLKGIDEHVKFRQYDDPDPIGISETIYAIALPQAIHVWKQALHHDELVENFWNVPIDMLKYMANVKAYSRKDEYDPVRQFAKDTQPAFERLFPDPAPVYKRFSFLWLFYEWDEFWEAVRDDRKRFTERKQRLNFYANYKF